MIRNAWKRVEIKFVRESMDKQQEGNERDEIFTDNIITTSTETTLI